jgi:hypothetical protein
VQGLRDGMQAGAVDLEIASIKSERSCRLLSKVWKSRAHTHFSNFNRSHLSVSLSSARRIYGPRELHADAFCSPGKLDLAPRKEPRITPGTPSCRSRRPQGSRAPILPVGLSGGSPCRWTRGCHKPHATLCGHPSISTINTMDDTSKI